MRKGAITTRSPVLTFVVFRTRAGAGDFSLGSQASRKSRSNAPGSVLPDALHAVAKLSSSARARSRGPIGYGRKFWKKSTKRNALTNGVKKSLDKILRALNSRPLGYNKDAPIVSGLSLARPWRLIALSQVRPYLVAARSSHGDFGPRFAQRPRHLDA